MNGKAGQSPRFSSPAQARSMQVKRAWCVIADGAKEKLFGSNDGRLAGNRIKPLSTMPRLSQEILRIEMAPAYATD